MIMNIAGHLEWHGLMSNMRQAGLDDPFVAPAGTFCLAAVGSQVNTLLCSTNGPPCLLFG